MIPLHQHPLTLPPLRRGRACPAHALSAAARYCFTHPVSPHTVGRGLDPSAARRGRRPPTKMARNHPTPAHPSAPRRGRACPARNLPAACRQSSTAHPPIICARQPPSPQYTPCPNFVLELCRKNQKNLQKPVDKGHTTCYNNQAVSRAQPAAAAAGAFTYSLYAVF